MLLLLLLLLRARTYTYVHLLYARGLHEGAVYENAVHSFARARVHPRAPPGGDGGKMRACAGRRTRTCGFLHFMIYRAAFSGPQSVPESAQIDKRNNRGREIEGLDLIRAEGEGEGAGGRARPRAR